ncbi:MAG: hypothetical protein AAGE52_06275 [Myxococcota bacterium]
MQKKTAISVIFLLAGCSFGFSDDVVAEGGTALRVTSLEMESTMASGPAENFRVSAEDRSVRLEFLVQGLEGTIELDELRAIVDSGGMGTLRMVMPDGYIEEQSIQLRSSVAPTEFRDEFFLGGLADEVELTFETFVGNTPVQGTVKIQVSQAYDC